MNTSPLRIKIIIGSTRSNRFSEKPAAWVHDMVKDKQDVEVEVLDLRDYTMPFFDEPTSPSMNQTGVYTNPVVNAWAKKIREADAYIVVAPEYNHGYSAVLKNAFDFVYYEWNKKTIGFVSYGSVGGARGVEQMREVAIELQMAPVRTAVHIPAPWTMLDGKGNLKPGSLDPFVQSAETMLTQVIWWGKALKVAREEKK